MCVVVYYRFSINSGVVTRSSSFAVMSSPLKHPFTAIISGPTGSGKTVFTLKFIEQASSMINPPPDEIVWCYGIYQSSFDDVKNVKFQEGLPDIKDFDKNVKTLLIIDDLMHETDDRVSQIFTKGSHHMNISVVYLTQNLFFSNKHARTMNLNSQHLVLFKNPRDAGQISYLGRQMFPGKSKFLTDAFSDATSKPYGYLFLDLKADTDEELRVRTNIFPTDTQYVYLPK